MAGLAAPTGPAYFARVKPTPRARGLFLGIVALGYLAIAGSFDWLSFAPEKDELHYWPTTLRFAAEPLPSIDLLRSYDEFSTPLPFVIFGWLEAAFGAGPAAGRWLNATVSFLIACLFVLTARSADSRVLRAAVGAWSFPYLLGTSFYLYTDVLAVAGAFAGLVAVRRQRWGLAALAFTLAVSSRQYMVAVPAAIALYRGSELLSDAGNPRRALRVLATDPTLLACAAGGAALLAWVALFRGLVPPLSTLPAPTTTAAAVFFPQHGLYFLAVIGVYYVPLAWLLLDRRAGHPVALDPTLVAGALFLGALSFVFPPLGNPASYGIESMGFLDRLLRWGFGDRDTLRVSALWVGACLCFWRFRRWSLASALVWTHALLLTKAHIAWDKYAMVCLLCLWYLQADDRSDASKVSEPAGESAPSIAS